MIQLNKTFFDELDKDKIQNLIALAQPYFDSRQKLYQRYLRKTNLNENMYLAKDKINIYFEYYIANMAQGYLSGKAPSYTVKESESAEKYQEAIDYIRRYNDDAATFTELIHDYLVTSAAYLYISENESNEIVYTRFDSRNSICVYDFGTPPYPIALIKAWEETNKDKEKVKKIEIITDKSRRIYNENGEIIPFEDYGGNGQIQTMTEKPLFWGDVPVAAFENPDSMAIFEPAIGLIDTYENLMTNIKNMTQYNDNAKLKVTGYMSDNPILIDECDKDGNPKTDTDGSIMQKQNPARQQEEAALYEAKALFLQNDGDVSWLIKDVNYSGILSVLKQLHDLITMLTGVPNMTDEAFSRADSAPALGYKLYSLDQYSSVADRIFRKGYLRLWEIITNRLNLKGADYDFRDIDIAFSRNVPTDKDKSIQRAVMAYNANLTSLYTAIGLANIDVDPESEIARIEAEKAKEYDNIREKLINSDNNGGEENGI